MTIYFALPKDLVNLLLSFVYEITSDELARDLEFYIKWRSKVPPMFLSATLLNTRFYFSVANPMVRYHPYTPRKNLRMRPTDIWACTLLAFLHGLSKERVRSLRTYRGCILRWAHDCLQNRKIEYYAMLHHRILSKLKPHHFRSARPSAFLAEALRQISVFWPEL